MPFSKNSVLKHRKLTLTAVFTLLVCVTLATFVASAIPAAGMANLSGSMLSGAADLAISLAGDEETFQSHPLSGSFLSVSSLTAKTGDTLTYAVLLHTSGNKEVTADVAIHLPAGLEYVSGGESYSSGTVSWDGVKVPASKDLELTFVAKVTADETGYVVANGEFTANGETLHVQCPVSVEANGEPGKDGVRPVVNSVEIGSSDILTDRDVTINIDASDDNGVVEINVREWAYDGSPFPQWKLVESTGWVNYESSISWTLSANSGVHYVGVWVKDEEGNISLLTTKSLDYANLLISNTELSTFGLTPYLVHLDEGTQVKVEVTATSGNPDLYVWYPEKTAAPDKWSVHSGKATETVSFTAPTTGTYLILVEAINGATYSIDFTVNGGTGDQANAGVSGFTAEPVLSKIGVDPLAAGNSLPYEVHVPMIFRR